MTDVSRRLRLRALAVATTLAISSMCASTALAAGRLDLSGLQAPEQKSFDRFIVKYREGTSERNNSASLGSSLRSASTAVPAKGAVRWKSGSCAGSQWARTSCGPTASWIAWKPNR